MADRYIPQRELRDQISSVVRAAFAPLLVDEPIAERYGHLLATARSEGRSAKASDLLMIAPAAASGRALRTLDDRQARLARAASVAVDA